MANQFNSIIHRLKSLSIKSDEYAASTTAAKEDKGIQINNFNVKINDAHILKNINLELPDKQITCIIGPSGCGKSTLLKSINRLIDQNVGVNVSGQILVDGEDIYDNNVEVTHIRKKMGLVSQRPTPLPMSIYDNVAYGCRLHDRLAKKELDAIVEETLRQADLWNEVKDRLSAPASALSIGQQQRLCLARGLAVKPRFILGDESTSALDPISSRHVEDLFVSLKEKYGVVLVTHTLHQALRIADNVVFIYLGEIIESGPAKEVFNNPKNDLTKQYLAGAFS